MSYEYVRGTVPTVGYVETERLNDFLTVSLCTGAGVASGRTCRPRHEREGPTQWEGLVLPDVTTAPDDNKKTFSQNLIRFLYKTQRKVELT